ncbi:MAG: fibronectin type III domain-containing protein, partial [Clostridia bacterium]|nr:fibronectin type III domain-containing protein [Clostridia bacterium]
MAKKKPVRGSSEKPDHIMISFYDDSRYSMAVTWRTCAQVKSGYAEYRMQGGETLVCEAESHPFISDIDESVIHTARLKNLTPGTRYYYTCGDESNRSQEFSFETQAEGTHKFTFLALADFQKGEPHDMPDYSKLGVFVKKILKEHPEIKFILSAGDSTDCGQHEQQWNGMFAGLEGIIESVPFMLALGNHDNRGFEDYEKGIGRYYAEPAEFFCKQFCKAFPDNG